MTEEVYLNDYQTLEEARANIEHFLIEFYNEQQMHSALAYLPPNEFEQMYCQGLRTNKNALLYDLQKPRRTGYKRSGKRRGKGIVRP